MVFIRFLEKYFHDYCFLKIFIIILRKEFFRQNSTEISVITFASNNSGLLNHGQN